MSHPHDPKDPEGLPGHHRSWSPLVWAGVIATGIGLGLLAYEIVPQFDTPPEAEAEATPQASDAPPPTSTGGPSPSQTDRRPPRKSLPPGPLKSTSNAGLGIALPAP